MLERFTELQAVPDVRQSNGHSCGAAVALAVGQFFDVGPNNEEAWIEMVGAAPEIGTAVAGIVQALHQVGLYALPTNDMAIDELAAWLQAGHPVICAMQYYDGTPEKQEAEMVGHFVVVVGVGPDMVVLQDPLAGRVELEAETFVELWHDRDTDDTA